jgi:prophage antirepressor-like protein
MKTDTPITENQPSNNTIQPFKSHLLSELFTFDNKPITILGTIDNPIFIGKQICDILEFTNSRKALKDNVEDKWKIKYKNLTEKYPGYLESNQSLQFNFRSDTDLITEAGLYSLIFNSKLEKAKIFRNTVFEQVLPSIRKTGQFKIEQLEFKLQQETKEKNRILKLHNQLTKKHSYYKFNVNGPGFYIVECGHEYKDGKPRPKIGIFGCYTGKYKNCPQCDFALCNKDESDSLDKRLRQHRTTWPKLQVKFVVYTPDALLLEKCIKRLFENEINPSGHEIVDNISSQDIIVVFIQCLKMFNVRNKESNYKIANDIEEYNVNVLTHMKEDEEKINEKESGRCIKF